jgi:hypothetical protein
MSWMPWLRVRVWPRALDLGATQPLLGAVVGLALVAVLVPVLYVFRGDADPPRLAHGRGAQGSPQRRVCRADSA